MATRTDFADRPLPVSVQEARRGLGWDVATLAREADVGVDVVLRAEQGDVVDADCLRAVCLAVGIDHVRRPLPTTPVDDGHVGRLTRLVEVAAREDGLLVVSDVQAFSEARGWSGPEYEDLERRDDRRALAFVASALSGGIVGLASMVLSGVVTVLDGPMAHPWDRIAFGCIALGLGWFVATALLSKVADLFWRPVRRLRSLREILRRREVDKCKGLVVTTDGLAEVEAHAVHVTRHEHRFSDVLTVVVEDASEEHVDVTVHARSAIIRMPWVRRDDPGLAVLSTWGRSGTASS